MDEIQLDVQIRNQIGSRKIKNVRRDDFVPAVVYGGERGPTTIKVDRCSYERIVRQYSGQSIVFHLNVFEGEKKLRDYSAIVKEEQLEPVHDTLQHIDFNRISLTKEIEIKVPITVKGEPVGVKQDGGSLDQPMWEIDIVCLPTNIPEKFEIDVTELKIGDSVHVKDISMPEGVITKHDSDAMVISIVPPMKEEEIEPVVEEEELTEPEVIKEKKEEEEVEGEKPQEEAPEKTQDKGKEKKTE